MRSTAVTAISTLATIAGGGIAAVALVNWNDQPYPKTPLEAQQVAQIDRELMVFFAFGAVIAVAGLAGLFVFAPRLRFRESLDDLRPEGKSQRAIERLLGAPSETRNKDGARIVTWSRGRASITLEFRDGACQQVLRITR